VIPMGMDHAEENHRTKGLTRLTMACNERCPFCNVPMEDYPRLTPPESEVLAELQSFFDSGAQTLTISGGEPTLLRRRLLSLVDKARQGGIRSIELQTNAVLIDGAYATDLAEAGLTSAFVSLLSESAELHDHLAGLPGAFPRCLAGIDALIAAGVSVTLNPVIASATQARVVDYMRFVVQRLPAVRSISLSAVQPHGRAADNLDLLPDYGVLAQQLPEARQVAQAAGVTVLNPYCGLPLCVGWSGDLGQCVEAAEARDGGWRARPGIDNQGNKSHGAVCGPCVLRPWCGGAWHAYWQHRDGAGIAPPAERIPPWRAGASTAPWQSVVSAPGGLTDAARTALQSAETPTIWLWTDRLTRADVVPLLTSRCTAVGLEVVADGLASGARPDWLRPLRALLRGGCAAHLAVRRPLLAGDRQALAALADRLGVTGVDVLPERQHASSTAGA
jgi:MoaA/NifB/PqqE/SkfB family radical SAM enzyme